MTHDARILPAACYQFGLACNLTTAYYILTMNEGMPGWYFPQIMLLYAPLIYLLNRFFLRRERSLLALLTVNLLPLAALTVAYLLLERWQGFAYFVFSLFFLCWLTYCGGYCATDGIPLPWALLNLDASFVLLVAFICYSSAFSLPIRWSIPSLAGLCACVVCAVILRSSRSPGLKGWLAVGGAFTLLLALLEVVTGAAAPAGRGLVALWNLIVQGYRAVTRLILRFFLWLLSLLPSGEYGEAETLEQWEAALPELPAEAETSPILSAVFFLMAAACVGAGVIWLLLRLRKVRLRSTGGKSSAAALPRRERVALLPALLRLVKGWYEAIRLRVFLWRHRNSPRGLYFLLVHRCRRAPWHKQSGETPRQFLSRLSLAADGDEVLSRALSDLAAETDAAFYSPDPAEKHLAYAPLIRRRMGAALARYFLRQTARRLFPEKS